MSWFSPNLIKCVAFGALAGCAPSGPPAPAPVVTVTGRLPTLAPLPETKQLQAKGGIQISVAPVLYSIVPSSEVSLRAISPSFLERLAGPQGWQTMRFLERTTTTALKTQPETLRFTITINNQLPRVFRGAGAVVQFNIAGKLIQVDQTGYADLVNIVVPPRTQQQVEIYGPPISAIPDRTTVSIFLYDVVTRADAAGNITEKQNFEWYYNYAVQLRQETANVVTERMWAR